MQVMKFIIMQFPPRSVFLPFRSKYPPQHCSQKPSVCVPPSKWETKFRTHTAQLTKLQFFFIRDGETKDFGLNNSKHSPNLIFSWFHHECHSDLLASSPSIWILPHFQTIH
jgi:hypothetical protein